MFQIAIGGISYFEGREDTLFIFETKIDKLSNQGKSMNNIYYQYFFSRRGVY
jgi:hypothetical protein